MTTRTELLDRMSEFPERVAAAARAAAARVAADRPVTDGEWTPEQVVRHLIAVETEVHQARLHDLASTAEPRWAWAEPGPWPGEPDLGLDGVIERFAVTRGATLTTLHALDDAGWARVGIHATFGELEHLRGLGDR